MTVHGDGSARRDFMFVKDHCEALDKLLHAPRDKVIGEVFNLGTGEDVSVLEIAETVKAAMHNSASPIELIGERPGQVIRHTCDAAKFRELMDWHPKHKFGSGLRETIDWYVANQEWWAPQRWLRHIPIVSAAGKRELH